MELPRMLDVEQKFAEPVALDIRSSVVSELERTTSVLTGGMRIAVGVGSRGISNLSEIVAATVDYLMKAGCRPFIIPAMGSHGGASDAGQRELLEGYGITEEDMGVPVKPSLEVVLLGQTEDGVDVFCSTEALGADGIVLINRIKPHTDFGPPLGSGILKMMVIGLGKQQGAAACHAGASRLGHERVIRTASRVLREKAPFLFGLGILEDPWHQTAKIRLVRKENLEAEEESLQTEARSLLPGLPFAEIDLLIVDYLGKNISGSGMDPNVIHRGVQGYSASLNKKEKEHPVVRRLFVRDITPESHGNAVGVGLADFTTTRLVQAIDRQVTYMNALTALTPQSAKIPIYFDTDRAAIERAIASLALPAGKRPGIVRIRDTLNLAKMQISENYLQEPGISDRLTLHGQPGELKFDEKGNLLGWSE